MPRKQAVKPTRNTMPSAEDLVLPTVQALRALGGSGTIEEIYQKVVELLGLREEITAVPHGNSGRSEVEYRLAWSRTYLRNSEIVENSARGVWALTPKGVDLQSLDAREAVRRARSCGRRGDRADDDAAESPATVPLPPTEEWEKRLRQVLLGLDPSAFERLIQRLLRESGFIQVHVTGRAGDGGIDGIGIARINGFLSFHVLFQCKRYQGAVSPSQVRDFRGAMQGRTDKGLFITTGTYTRDAMKEATRDGAPPIDLIDGEQLVQRLKELGLGVKVRMIEAVDIDTAWFSSL